MRRLLVRAVVCRPLVHAPSHPTLVNASALGLDGAPTPLSSPASAVHSVGATVLAIGRTQRYWIATGWFAASLPSGHTKAGAPSPACCVPFGTDCLRPHSQIKSIGQLSATMCAGNRARIMHRRFGAHCLQKRSARCFAHQRSRIGV